MALDLPTLLVVSVLAVLMLSGAYLVVWAQDRREAAILWSVGANALGSFGAAARVLFSEQMIVVVSNVAVLVALGALLMACRALSGRAATAGWLFVPSILWTLACLLPWLQADRDARIILATVLSTLLCGAVFRELWRGRSDGLVARRVLLGLVGFTVIGMGMRVAATLILKIGWARSLPLSQDIAVVTLWSMAFMLLSGFGIVVAVKERSERRYRRAARRDVLTGLGNRRHFNEMLEREFKRAERLHSPLSLLMIDADAFKAFNDRYGHPAGDRCLQDIANVLQRESRSASDVAVRYGGEEFAVLLPDTGHEGSLHVAERMRQDVEALAIPHADQESGLVTVSIGVATILPGRDADMVRLVSDADRGLYVAKRDGRNCVRTVAPPGSDLRLRLVS